MRLYKLNAHPRATQLTIVILMAALSACGGEKSDVQKLRDQMSSVAPSGSANDFLLPDEGEYAKIPQDPRNPITRQKVELGKRLFHDPVLLTSSSLPQGMQSASCASCHVADAGFQAGIRQAIGEGGMGTGARGTARVRNPAYNDSQVDVVPLRAPSTLNVAYQDVMGWSGNLGALGVNRGTEALWAKASVLETNWLGLSGPETQAMVAHDVHHMDIEKARLDTNAEYRALFAAAFPGMSQPITIINFGLAVGAYERTLLPSQAPFQKFLRGDDTALASQAVKGAQLFFGRAQCYQCHSGPALSSTTFHALGMGDMLGQGVLQSSENSPEHLGRGGFTRLAADMYKFKTPQLYNMADTQFFGHGGSFPTLRSVLEYKNAGRSQNARVPVGLLSASFKPLGLSAGELDELEAFLRDGLRDPNLRRYLPAAVPSGLCPGSNDAATRAERGC